MSRWMDKGLKIEEKAIEMYQNYTMEKETKPGVFISVITLDQWQVRTAFLTGEDLKYFVEKCNPIRMATDSIKDVIGVNREELFTVCKDLEPNFNPLTDYYVIQHKL